MTTDKAIYRLECDCKQMDRECDCKKDGCDGCYIKIAIDAVEKQVPKKPIIEGEDMYSATAYYCPSCYELDGHKDWKRKIVYDQGYCDCCGQAIEWDESR